LEAVSVPIDFSRSPRPGDISIILARRRLEGRKSAGVRPKQAYPIVSEDNQTVLACPKQTSDCLSRVSQLNRIPAGNRDRPQRALADRNDFFVRHRNDGP
jgi:hypothetical protein